MFLEFLSLVVGYYLFAGLCVYVYSVIKSYEVTGFWSFKINNGYIALCKYPRWLLFWLEWIMKKVRGF